MIDTAHPLNLADPQMRRKFVEQAGKLVKKHKFDGVELDFNVSLSVHT